MNSSELSSSSPTSSRAIEANNHSYRNISDGSSSCSNNRTTSRDLEKLSSEIRKYPGDQRSLPTSSDLNHHLPLPQSFRKSGKKAKTELKEPENEDLELSLGLSLGGKFGVNKSHMGLMRSSSIAGTFPLNKEDVTVAPPPSVTPTLPRTSSLPVETEEDSKKRKEHQLRRLVAKRRRSEKQRSAKENLEGGREDAKLNLNVRGRSEKEQEQFTASGNKLDSSMATSSGSNQLVGGDGGGGGVGLKKRSFFSSLQGLLAQQGSQGSGESQVYNSSGASEPDIKSVQGSSEASPSSILPQQERGTHEATCYGSKNPDPSSKQPEVAENKTKELGASALDDMPSVFTIGDPPNGRKVEGILYRYGKGEEVRIMCICHGSFFSAVEFVKHAGGRDLEHPHRHIVVNPSSSSF